jgi:ATP-dependent exoDNAse (exonuclease V) alpha subunit
VTLVGDAPGLGRPERFSTHGLTELEREALRIAREGKDAGAPRAGAAHVSAALAAAPVALSDEQRDLVSLAALSRDRVVCVVGVAGAGKTTALRAASEALGRAGVSVLGTAPSGRAADELRQSAAIPARTLHSLLSEARRAGGLPRGSVLVLDEAGMAETRVLTPVLQLVEESDGKVILVGDPAQLPSVGAGGLFDALCAQVGAVHLAGNRRQREGAEREALARLRSGDAEGYISRLAMAGRLVITEDSGEAKGRLLADWWTAVADSDPREAVMLAGRRADVNELNRAARALLLDAGRLGEDALSCGGRDFRAGDRVVCRRNDSRLGVCNGTRALVGDVDPVLGTIGLTLDAGRSRRVPIAYAAESLEHGYAITGHSAQGSSVERAFVLVRAEGALAEWGYVAASRARSETRLYAVGPELADDALRATEAPTRADLLARALARPAARPWEIDLRPRSSDERRPPERQARGR